MGAYLNLLTYSINITIDEVSGHSIATKASSGLIVKAKIVISGIYQAYSVGPSDPR